MTTPLRARAAATLPEQPLLTVADLATHAGLTGRAVRAAIAVESDSVDRIGPDGRMLPRQRGLFAIKEDGTWRIPRAAASAWLDPDAADGRAAAERGTRAAASRARDAVLDDAVVRGTAIARIAALLPGAAVVSIEEGLLRDGRLRVEIRLDGACVALAWSYTTGGAMPALVRAVAVERLRADLTAFGLRIAAPVGHDDERLVDAIDGDGRHHLFALDDGDAADVFPTAQAQRPASMVMVPIDDVGDLARLLGRIEDECDGGLAIVRSGPAA